MKLTHAMILAAGLGTRMRPLTLTKPKPLIEVAGKALIDWNIEWLHDAGIKNIVVNTSYLAEQLEDHLGKRAAISREGAPPLETGGGVNKALKLLGKDVFLTMNSDAIMPYEGEHPVQRLAAAWKDDADFLLLLVKKENAIGWQGNGDFVLGEEGRIRRAASGENADHIFTGVELIHPRAFKDAPKGAFSLSTLWQKDAKPGSLLPRVRAIVHEGTWLNVGDLASLKTAEDFLRRP